VLHGQGEGGVAAGAETKHVHRVQLQPVEDRHDVAGGVLGGERPVGRQGAAVAFLVDGDHLPLGSQERDEAGEVRLDGGAAAGDEEQRCCVGCRAAVDLVVHAELAVGRVSMGESHTAS